MHYLMLYIWPNCRFFGKFRQIIHIFCYICRKFSKIMLAGRIAEQRELRDAFESEYSEFVAVYGRHRVGKTFLVRETFNYNFTFEHSGVANAPIRMQLKAFRDSLVDAGMKKLAVPSDWMEAFTLLRQLIKR